MLNSRHLMTAGALLASALFAGCGGDPNLVSVYPTTGTLSMGGEPFGPTLINLQPKDEGGRMVVGKVDEQGKITFATFDIGDGVPAGKYRVMIGKGPPGSPPPRPFPKIYHTNQSPLTVEIAESDMNELSIEMDPNAGPLMGGGSPAAKMMGASQKALMNPETPEE